jgi:hypothetical protein
MQSIDIFNEKQRRGFMPLELTLLQFVGSHNSKVHPSIESHTSTVSTNILISAINYQLD